MQPERVLKQWGTVWEELESFDPESKERLCITRVRIAESIMRLLETQDLVLLKRLIAYLEYESEQIADYAKFLSGDRKNLHIVK